MALCQQGEPVSHEPGLSCAEMLKMPYPGGKGRSVGQRDQLGTLRVCEHVGTGGLSYHLSDLRLPPTSQLPHL